MSRILEGIFVLGCSLAGFALSVPRGQYLQGATRYAVQLVSFGSDASDWDICHSLRRMSIGLRASKP